MGAVGQCRTDGPRCPGIAARSVLQIDGEARHRLTTGRPGAFSSPRLRPRGRGLDSGCGAHAGTSSCPCDRPRRRANPTPRAALIVLRAAYLRLIAAVHRRADEGHRPAPRRGLDASRAPDARRAVAHGVHRGDVRGARRCPRRWTRGDQGARRLVRPLSQERDRGHDHERHPDEAASLHRVCGVRDRGARGAARRVPRPAEPEGRPGPDMPAPLEPVHERAAQGGPGPQDGRGRDARRGARAYPGVGTRSRRAVVPEAGSQGDAG